MFYVYRHKVLAGDDVDNKQEDNIHLTEGVVHQVDVMFQSGCENQIHVQLWQADRQLWPTNRDESLTGDGTIISFREFHPVAPGNQILTIKSWHTLAIEDKYIEVHLGVLPKKVIQPLSFEELLAAAAGIE